MRRQTKELLKAIHEFCNMSPKERNQAIVNEQVEKFKARNGRVKRLQPQDRNIELIMSRGSGVEAIDYLRV